MLTRTRCINDTIIACEVTAPVNGNLGGCPEKLPSGDTCQFDCDFGFVLNGNTTCTAGVLTPGACDQGEPCTISALPELVRPGDCPVTPQQLASGTSCQPECNDLAEPGAVIGQIRCDNGTLLYPFDTCLPKSTCQGIGGVCESNSDCCDDGICADGVCGAPDGPAREEREIRKREREREKRRQSDMRQRYGAIPQRQYVRGNFTRNFTTTTGD